MSTSRERLELQPQVGTLADFESFHILETGLESLQQQAFVFEAPQNNGNTSKTKPGLQGTYQRLYHEYFTACVGVGLGLEERIDITKYMHQTIRPVSDWDVRQMDDLDSMLDMVEVAVERSKVVSELATAVTNSFRAEITDDLSKQYSLIKILETATTQHIEPTGLTSHEFALAAFITLTQPDSSTGIKGQLVEDIELGVFDDYFAKDVLDRVVDGAAEGDSLTKPEVALLQMLTQLQYYSGDELETVIATMSSPSGIEQWSPLAQDMLDKVKQSTVAAIAVNHDKLRLFCNLNYLSAEPTDFETFKQTTKEIHSRAKRASKASSNGANHHNGAVDAEKRKRERLLRRFSDSDVAHKILPEKRSKNTVMFLCPNGQGNSGLNTEPGRIVSDFLKSYNNDPAVAEDVDRMIGYLARLNGGDTSRHGVRKLGVYETVEGKKLPVSRLKTKEASGLPRSSPHTLYTRIIFVRPAPDVVAIVAIKPRDEFIRFMANRYGQGHCGQK